MAGQNIVLTGFMGTGKTTVGKLLAKKLGYKFLDTDQIIMSRCNMTVAEIFKIKGEALFRKMERELALELSLQDKLVISTGGAMMLDPFNVDALERKITYELEDEKGEDEKNNDLLKKQGMIFCLVADPDEIVARVSGDNGIERPLLKVDDPKARIAELLNERKEGYARFVQVDTTALTPEAVCKVIMDMFEKQL
ncbi:MAG: shikimate kinase [Desulfamplus sp.]|nr:shikimate kinase [Desulfamplus sp.]MBF0259896.1 shikimate kinase [Desulfamplus sp.]